MAKKKETIQDILDRINEDIEAIRDKVDELENHECDSDEDFKDEDEDEQIIKKRQPELLQFWLSQQEQLLKSSSAQFKPTMKVNQQKK